MPPVSPNGVPFCSPIAWSRSRARITPSTGPKHSVWWNHDPRSRPAARRASSAGWPPGSRAPRRDPAARGSTSHDSPVVEPGQRPEQGVARRPDQRRRSSSPGRRPRRPAALRTASASRSRKSDVVVDRRRRRSPGWRPSTSGRRGRTPSARCRGSRRRCRPTAVTTMAFLPLVSASRWSRGFHAEEQLRGVVGAGEDHGVDVVVGDQPAADLVVGAGDELHHVAGDARLATAGWRAATPSRRSRAPA